MKKIYAVLTSAVFIVFLIAGGILFLFMPDADSSLSERRPLKKMPEVTREALASGTFFSEFETYSADQMPFRESLKTVKAVYERYVLGRLESNGIVIQNGSAVKLKTDYRRSLLESNTALWSDIAKKYCPSAKVYCSVIPDKAYFLRDTIYPTLDYDALTAELRAATSESAKEIPLWDILTLSDYYSTDLHWRQEKIYSVALRIAQAMETEIEPEAVYSPRFVGYFNGVYAEQSSIPMRPDSLNVEMSETLSACRVFTYRVNADGIEKTETDIYDSDSPDENDLYSVFLSGSEAVVEIVNGNTQSGKTLVLLRDSFASSLAPYLVSGYKRIVMLDMRYISSKKLASLSELHLEEADDLLCLYSVTALTETQMR